MNTYIIIPCLNESENIVKVINSVKEYGQVVIVDDGSIDNSYNLASNQGVVVLKHFINRGQGAALETGHRYALKHGADIVIHFDSDGQHNSEEIPKLIEPLLLGKADIVLGSRFLSGNDKTPWIKKYFILKPVIFFQNILLGLNLTDAHNGFRALNSQALSKIHIKQDGMAHATEIVNLIKEHDLKYIEVPVIVNYNEFGQGVIGGLKILKDLLFSKINK